MALKFKVTAQYQIPDAHRSLYVERDAAWVLDVEGAADNGKLEESRANNFALSNELKTGG